MLAGCRREVPPARSRAHQQMPNYPNKGIPVLDSYGDNTVFMVIYHMWGEKGAFLIVSFSPPYRSLPVRASIRNRSMNGLWDAIS